MNGRKTKRFWGFAAVLLCVLLVASLALNVFLLKRSTADYLDLNDTRLDPLGIGAYPSEGHERRADEKLVVLYGDSRAYQWSVTPHMPGVEFVNRGVGAQTSAQVLGRFDAHVQSLRPDIVIVQVGINDLKTLPLFPERRASIISHCKENIRQIVTKSLNLGAVVVLTTIFPVGDVPIDRRLFWSDDVSLAVDEVNGYIKSLEQDRVIVFDAFAVLADEMGKARGVCQTDTLHINEAGYAALNQELSPILIGLTR